jgi:predicted MPP superfamily phosphohydrolase
VLGILGNNDTGEFVRDFQLLGVDILVNENKRICRENESIWIAAVDDPHGYRCDSLPDALGGIPNGAFTILLAHSPEIAYSAAQCGIDLYLCGHTHGGQINFPRIGPVFRNSRSPYRMMHGLWRVGEMQGYTTTGLGTSTLPVRYNCSPEAVVFMLQSC